MFQNTLKIALLTLILEISYLIGKSTFCVSNVNYLIMTASMRKSSSDASVLYAGNVCKEVVKF